MMNSFLGKLSGCSIEISSPSPVARDYYQPKRLILCGKTWMKVSFATRSNLHVNSLTLARDSLPNTQVIPHYHPSRVSQ
jgi:hypothetical protein